VVLGAAAALPWCDGARYLGRDPEAPALYVPTAIGPDLPVSLVERAVLRLAPAPVAVLPLEDRLVSVAAARPLARDALGKARFAR
jgi:hypothetical protein